MDLTTSDLASEGMTVKFVIEDEELSGVVRVVHPDGFAAVAVSRLTDAERDNYTDDIYRVPVSELKL